MLGLQINIGHYISEVSPATSETQKTKGVCIHARTCVCVCARVYVCVCEHDDLIGFPRQAARVHTNTNTRIFHT